MRHHSATSQTCKRCCVLVCFLAVAAGGGCGCRGDPLGVGKTFPVRGQVTVSGQPLRLSAGAFGRVWFYPDASRGNNCPQVPSGDIDADGNYQLATRGQVGAPPGWYRVMIVATQPADPSVPKKRRKSFVNLRYTALETSGLAVEVVEKPTAGGYDLRLKP